MLILCIFLSRYRFADERSDRKSKFFQYNNLNFDFVSSEFVTFIITED